MILSGGARLSFHSLSAGVPRVVRGTPTGQTTYDHPVFEPNTSFWTRTHEAAIAALPAAVKSHLPHALMPPWRLILPDADIFAREFTAPRYRFAFEVTGGDFNFAEWDAQITNALDHSECHIVRWASQGSGCLAVTSGPLISPTNKLDAPGWLKVFCDHLPDHVTSFNLVLRRKSKGGKVDLDAETITYAFPNPLGETGNDP